MPVRLRDRALRVPHGARGGQEHREKDGARISSPGRRCRILLCFTSRPHAVNGVSSTLFFISLHYNYTEIVLFQMFNMLDLLETVTSFL